MADFLDFILAAQFDPKLASDFLSKKTAQDLTNFFSTKGYTIATTDIPKILQAKNNLNLSNVPPDGPVPLY